MTSYRQAATEKRNYQAVVANDTIVSATATIAPTGPTLGTVSVASTTATLAVSGLTAEIAYVLKLLCTLTSGQILQAECKITGE